MKAYLNLCKCTAWLSYYFLSCNDDASNFYYENNQGRTMWRNCRLNTKNPDNQLGWAILAINAIFILYGKISPNLTCYITLRVQNINGQYTIPPLCSSLLTTKRSCYDANKTRPKGLCSIISISQLSNFAIYQLSN